MWKALATISFVARVQHFKQVKEELYRGKAGDQYHACKR